MESITRYMADDGTEFKTLHECAQYENFTEQVDNIEKTLLPHPKNSDTVSSQNRNVVADVRRFVAERSHELGIPKDVCDGFITCNNILLRYLCDSSGSPMMRQLNNLAWRCQCMDRDCVEYEQPYFAIQSDRNNKK